MSSPALPLPSVKAELAVWFGPRSTLFAPFGAQASRVTAVDLTPELLAEQGLVARAHAGDPDALGQLLKMHGPRLYRAVLLPRLGSVAAAEEALSVTYLKVVERFDQFSWQALGVYPWLRIVALRVALDELRRRKRHFLFQPEDLERELENSERQSREAARTEADDLAAARDKVVRVLGRLNPRYARALTLRVLEERPREECAATLEVSTATFDVVLHRAVTALKKELFREADRAD